MNDRLGVMDKGFYFIDWIIIIFIVYRIINGKENIIYKSISVSLIVLSIIFFGQLITLIVAMLLRIILYFLTPYSPKNQ